MSPYDKCAFCGGEMATGGCVNYACSSKVTVLHTGCPMSAERLTDEEVADIRSIAEHGQGLNPRTTLRLLRAYESLVKQAALYDAECNMCGASADDLLAFQRWQEGCASEESEAVSALATEKAAREAAEKETLRVTGALFVAESEVARLREELAKLGAAAVDAAHAQVEALLTERTAREQAEARVKELERTAEQFQEVYHLVSADRLRAAESALASARAICDSVNGTYKHPDQLARAVCAAFDRIRALLSSAPAPVTAPSPEEQDSALMVGNDLSAHLGSGRLLGSKPVASVGHTGGALQLAIDGVTVAAPCAGCAELAKHHELMVDAIRRNYTGQLAERDADIARHMRTVAKRDRSIEVLKQAINAAVEQLEPMAKDCHVAPALAALRAARKGQP